jgi:intracellular sulfur oxidation DsrE/DsrF family protein
MLTRRSVLSTMLAVLTGSAVSAVAAKDDPAKRSSPGAAVDSHAHTERNKKSCTDSPNAHKAMFQLSDARDTALVLRVVTNYLLAVPNAEVTVVGYNSGGEFMLKDARDPDGKPYAEQINRLADRGVVFKACNNWLKSRNLTPGALVSPVAVVPSAVIEILRLQNEEGFAYFRP